MDFIGFMFFSALEGVAVFCLILQLFRYNPVRYLREILIIDILICLISFFLRESLEIGYLDPLIKALILVVFMFAVIRAPLLWSFFSAITGYIIFLALQTILIIPLNYLSLISLDNIQHNTKYTYIIQAAEFVVFIPVTTYFYRRGFGFAFSFKTLTWSWEKVLVSLVLLTSMLGFGVVFYIKDLLWAGGVFIFMGILLLYYSIHRERANYD